MEKRPKFSLVACYSFLITRCKITRYSLQNSLVTRCRSCSLQKSILALCKIRSLLVAEIHSLLVVKFARYSLQKFARYFNAEVARCKIHSLLVAEVARCKKSLLLIKKLLVLKSHLLLVAKFDRCLLHKVTK